MSDVVSKVIDSSTLQRRIDELGEEINRDYADKEPVMLAVLSGALFFVTDLSRRIHPRVDIDFLSLTRFGEEGRVGIAMDSGTQLAGRDVIVVEDIVDTGLTLSYLLGLLTTRKPASLRTVTLFDKTTRRIVDVPLEYRGFEVGDEFLLGYGLDYEGRYRNLHDIWAVLDLGEFTSDESHLASKVFPGGGDRLRA